MESKLINILFKHPYKLIIVLNGETNSITSTAKKSKVDYVWCSHTLNIFKNYGIIKFGIINGRTKKIIMTEKGQGVRESILKIMEVLK